MYCRKKFFGKLAAVCGLRQRKQPSQHSRMVYLGHYVGVQQLIEPRYAYYHVNRIFLQHSRNVGGRYRFWENQFPTDVQRHYESPHKRQNMVEWQHYQHSYSVEIVFCLRYRLHVGVHIRKGKHHSLRVPGRSGCVHYKRHVGVFARNSPFFGIGYFISQIRL